MRRLGEWLLGGWRGDMLETWEQRRKIRRFQSEVGSDSGAAHLDPEHVKGHFQDHGQRILARYAEGLRAHGLPDDGIEMQALGWPATTTATSLGAPMLVGASLQPVTQ